MDGEVRRESVNDVGKPRPREGRATRADPAGGRAAIIGARWRFLAEASALLDRSLDYQETLANVVRLVVPRMADYAIVALLAEDGSLTWGYSAHCDSSKEALVGRLRAYQPHLTTEGHPTAEALRSGETVVVDVVDEAVLRSVARDATHLALLRQLALTSVIIIPLAARGRVLGSLLLATTRDSNRRYTDRDVAIANEVGRRAALAVDHALLYQAAERAGRAREQMVAVVSHDLKNPLATIQMAVSLLLEDLVPDDEPHKAEREHLRAIDRSAQRMYRLIHDLLDVAAIEAGQFAVSPSPLAVGVLVDDALELLRPLASAKRVALVANVPPDLPAVAADRERVLQVFSNVVGNAVKFTPANGRIEIEATRRGGSVEFVVQDGGPGIAPDDLPHVFDRFWQAKKMARAGVGLGLAIAKGIIEAHGGEIRAESRPGHGARFTFTLPVAAG